MKTIEEWRYIKGYEGLYQVSNLGNIKSLSKIDGNGVYRKERLLKPILNSHGYYVVMLYKNNKGVQKLVHRLVANAFIPNPNNLPHINHKDEIKTNNHADNLEWCDIAYNNRYGNRSKKVVKALGQPVISISLLDNCISFYPSIAIATKKAHINDRDIQNVLKGRKRQHKGVVWRYATEEEIKKAYEMAGEIYE